MCDVSIIVPIYNGEKYLIKCLDSLSNQTLRNIEIICVNDGSTDDTGIILDKYSSKDSRIKVISTANNGQGFARNIALKEANGEYVAFVDSDDWIELNALELLFSNAKSNNLDLLFFQMVNYMDVSGNLVETDLYNHSCFDKNNIIDNVTFNYTDTKEFLFEIPVCPVSKLYKKEFLNSFDLKFPEGMFFEDNVFFYNVYFQCDKAGFLKKQLYYRRRHQDSVTQTFDEKKFDIIKAANGILDVFLFHGEYEIYKNDLINHTFSMILEWFNKSPLELCSKFYNLIKNDFKGFQELQNDFRSNLNDDFFMIFDLIVNNDYFLDFLSEYKLTNCDYIIFDNGKEYELNTESYFKYKTGLSKKYKLSVIIPIYNNETLIHRTLMSIENQTIGVGNIEVLMVDDASTDNTYETLKKYSNNYDGFKVIHIKKGTGSPGTPRNIGLKEASAKYVIFLDHDDLFEINALDILYNSIIESNSDVVYGTYVSIDVDLPTKIIYPNEQHGYFGCIEENERSIAFPPPSIWTKLFKKEFLLKNNILFPTILGEDAIFVSKVLINAKGIDYLWDSIICYHTLNEKSYTKNISYKYLIEGFVSEEYIYDFYKKMHHENYYEIRGEGILDFYLSQFMKSNLNNEEIIKIFPFLYSFVKNIDCFGLKPHVNELNKIIFNHIINNDIDAILKIKNPYNESNSTKRFKLKSILKRLIKKIK